MPPSRPFIDPVTMTLDTDQILAEVFPLAGLVVLFGALALLLFLPAFLLGRGLLSLIFTVLAQLALAVGTGIVLMYVVARGIQLAEE